MLAPRFNTLSAIVGAWEVAARSDPHRPFIRILRSSPPPSQYVCPLRLEWGRTPFGWEAILSRSKALTYSNHLMDAMHTDGRVIPPARVVVSVTSPMLYILVVLAAWRGNIPFLPVDARRQSYAVGTLMELGVEKVVVVDDGFVRDAVAGSFNDGALHTPPSTCGMKRCRSADVDGSPFDDNDCSHIIFTSGTTGAPKLVLTSRSNMAVYGQAFATRAHIPTLLDTSTLEPPPRILAVSSSSFDPSLGDILAAIISGGELIVNGGSSPEEVDGTFQGIGGAIPFLTTHADYTH